MIGTTGDPATPYQWAVNLSKELASGVLLTRKGEGHTGYSDSTCIQQKVDTYLLTLTDTAAEHRLRPVTSSRGGGRSPRPGDGRAGA